MAWKEDGTYYFDPMVDEDDAASLNEADRTMQALQYKQNQETPKIQKTTTPLDFQTYN